MNLQQFLSMFSDGISIVSTARNIKRTTSLLKILYLVFGGTIIALNIITVLKTINRPKLA